jgi:hypothetical protein
VRDAALIYDAERLETLEAPAKTLAQPPESPAAATEQPGRLENRRQKPQAQVEGAQEAGERESWWRRLFEAQPRPDRVRAADRDGLCVYKPPIIPNNGPTSPPLLSRLDRGRAACSPLARVFSAPSDAYHLWGESRGRTGAGVRPPSRPWYRV